MQVSIVTSIAALVRSRLSIYLTFTKTRLSVPRHRLLGPVSAFCFDEA